MLARGLAGPPAANARYLIFGQGRSGSTVLGSLLASHPALAFADEILYRPVLDARLWARGLRASHPDLVWGFHVKSYQLTIQQGIVDPGGWLSRMVDEGWRLIHLERHDVVRQVVSNAVASARGAFHRHEGDPIDAPRPQIDPTAFVEVVQARLRTLEEDRTAVVGLPHELVVYERDLLEQSRHQDTADRLFTMLGLTSLPVHTPLRRTSTRPWDDIANWPDIVAAVQAAGLARHLPEDA